jgi:hypothetical protein
MQALWKLGPSSVSDVQKALPQKLAYTAVAHQAAAMFASSSARRALSAAHCIFPTRSKLRS